MEITNNAFSQYKETRALSGYKSAWLVKHPDDTSGKYSLIGATETAPYVFGSKNTFDYDLLQSAVIGQVEGKMTLESQDIEVLHHRDNAYRYEKLKGKVLEFMTINAEFVGYKFSGTIDYKPNTAEAEVNRATVTITPIDATTTPVYNARPEVIETLCFASAIPATVKVGDTIDLAVVQTSATVTLQYKFTKIADGTNAEEVDDGAFTVVQSTTKYTAVKAGLYAIKVEDTATTKQYAPWVTTVYVEANSAT